MMHTKTIRTGVWLAGLTITAYVLAHSATVIISRGIDATLRSAPINAQHHSDNNVPLLPRLNASDGNATPGVSKTNAFSNVKVEQVSDTRWILDRPSLLANTRDLNRFLKQARVVPYVKQGRTVGFRITGISQGSLHEKIGLRNGNVLFRVNTVKLNDSAKLFRLYQEMRNKRHISLLLSRNRQDQTFHYEIR